MTHNDTQRWDDERDLEDEKAFAFSGPSSVDDMIREQARYDGQFCPQREWLVSDFDSYVRNPHYKGPRTEEPEL